MIDYDGLVEAWDELEERCPDCGGMVADAKEWL